MLAHLLRFEYQTIHTPDKTLNPILLSYCQEDELINSAHHHGLDAFLFRMIFQHHLSRYFSPSRLSGLEKRAMCHQIQLLRNQHSLYQLLNSIPGNFCPVVLLKGSALTHILYGDTKDRQFNDLDLLVATDRLDQMTALLHTLQYKQDPYRRSREAALQRLISQHLPPFRREGCTIELHTRLLPREYGSFSRHFFINSYPITWNNVSARLPDQKYHLLFLMAHIEKHARSGLLQWRLLRDIALLTGHHTSIWSPLYDLAAEYQLTHEIKFVQDRLFALYDWSPAAIDLHHISIHMHRPVSGFSTIRQILNRIPDTRTKIRWLAGWIFPAPGYMRFRYPQVKGWNIYLVYLQRWIRGFIRIIHP